LQLCKAQDKTKSPKFLRYNLLIVKGSKWRVDEFLSWRRDSYDNATKTVGQFLNLNKSTIHKLTSGSEIPGLTTGQLQRFHMGESYTGSQENIRKGVVTGQTREK